MTAMLECTSQSGNVGVKVQRRSTDPFIHTVSITVCTQMGLSERHVITIVSLELLGGLIEEGWFIKKEPTTHTYTLTTQR